MIFTKMHDLKRQILNLPMKFIKQNAIPHLNLPLYCEIKSSIDKHRIWIEKQNVCMQCWIQTLYSEGISGALQREERILLLDHWKHKTSSLLAGTAHCFEGKSSHPTQVILWIQQFSYKWKNAYQWLI